MFKKAEIKIRSNECARNLLAEGGKKSSRFSKLTKSIAISFLKLSDSYFGWRITFLTCRVWNSEFVVFGKVSNVPAIT